MLCYGNTGDLKWYRITDLFSTSVNHLEFLRGEILWVPVELVRGAAGQSCESSAFAD